MKKFFLALLSFCLWFVAGFLVVSTLVDVIGSVFGLNMAVAFLALALGTGSGFFFAVTGLIIGLGYNMFNAVNWKFSRYYFTLLFPTVLILLFFCLTWGASNFESKSFSQYPPETLISEENTI